MMFRIIYVCFFVVTFLCTLTYGEEFSECENQPIGSYIAVSSNCSKYINCAGAESTIVDCSNEEPYFSPEDEMCYSSFSICGDRPFSLGYISTTTIETLSTSTAATAVETTTSVIKTSTATTKTTTPVANATTGAVTIPASVAPATSSIAINIQTTASTSANAWTPVQTTSSTNHYAVILQCPSVDAPGRPLFLPHTNSCSKYYLCYHGNAFLMECPNRLHFDVMQQSCNSPIKAKCQVKVNYVLSAREQCQPRTVDVYPHATNCNYYYLCEYGFLMVMQCPFNMGWDYKKRICAMTSKVNCYNRNSNFN